MTRYGKGKREKQEEKNNGPAFPLNAYFPRAVTIGPEMNEELSGTIFQLGNQKYEGLLRNRGWCHQSEEQTPSSGQ